MLAYQQRKHGRQMLNAAAEVIHPSPLMLTWMAYDTQILQWYLAPVEVAAPVQALEEVAKEHGPVRLQVVPPVLYPLH